MAEKGKYYVRSVAKTIVCYNLPTKTPRGKPASLIMGRGDTSRALTEKEFRCPEVQKGLKGRDLLDVTRQMSK